MQINCQQYRRVDNVSGGGEKRTVTPVTRMKFELITNLKTADASASQSPLPSSPAPMR
jgi:hypothetical protein